MAFKGEKVGLSIAMMTLLLAGLLTVQCRQGDAVASLPDQVDFNFHVRPILVRNCYLCHGPDPGSRKADLRLDTFEGATALLEEGGRYAIVPGDAGESEVIHRITSRDAQTVMPPPESNLTLSEYEIAVLKKWIDQGAEWKKHWAFIPPKHSQPTSQTSTHAVDDFIGQQIQRQGLEPVAAASKAALIRRVSYLLTGLPPTAEELAAFRSDESLEAYEKVVEEYLDSPAFGERWARHWMDVVRYAETRGHEFDYEIVGAWRYRDYLIRAFNEDVPYDQFVREHLAGDMISDVRWNPESGINESQIGTAFFTLGEGKHSPVDIREEEVDRIDNMIDVTSKTFQALTVSCAKCHDHKFDPIPTADYYAMYGVMESSRFSPKPAQLSFDQVENLKEVEKLKCGIEQMLLRNVPELDKKPTPTDAPRETPYDLLGDFRGETLDGWKSDGLAFGQQTTLGDPFSNASGTRITRFEEGKASSRRLAPGIFGALRSPNFEITQGRIGVRALGEAATIRVVIDNFQLIQWPIYGGLEHKVDSKQWEDFVFDVSAWKGHKAYIEVMPGTYDRHIYSMSESSYVEVAYAIAYDGEWPQTVAPQHVHDLKRVAQLNYLLTQGQIPRTVQGLDAYFETRQKLIPTLKDSTFFMGIDEGFGINSPVFERGNHLNELEKEVPRGFLSAVTDQHQFETKGSGRLELAEAILDPANPLTARVMVNRIWHHLFGRGLVETVDNFGLQGKLPSHPELLDYLALKFQEDGYSIKSMIKYLVMSETFRRATTGSEKALAQDPDNLWLSHFPVRRMEAEAIRDGLLAVSGQLNDTMYGEPVPVYLTDFMTGRGRPWESGPLDGEGRRSIYQAVRRNFLEPMMLTFDRPIPFSTFGKRNVTNVPAQSLILMNDPFVIQQARHMAELVLSSDQMSDEEKIDFIYVRALSRNPTTEELQQAAGFLSALAQSHDLTPEDGRNSLEVWQDYCHAVFNLKEFIYLI